MQDSPGGRWPRLGWVCLVVVLATAASSCGLPSLLTLTTGAGVGKAPGNLGEINRECWDASTLAVIQKHRLRVASASATGGVDAFWDFMTHLCASQQQKHRVLFVELAQVFWARYVDCVLSRAHGMGKKRSGNGASRRGHTGDPNAPFITQQRELGFRYEI